MLHSNLRLQDPIEADAHFYYNRIEVPKASKSKVQTCTATY